MKKELKMMLGICLMFVSCLCSAEQMMGGWTKQKEASNDVTEIAYFAVSQSHHNAKISSLTIENYSTQVVAGVNYKIKTKYSIEGKSYCNTFIVYKNLDGDLSLSSEEKCTK